MELVSLLCLVVVIALGVKTKKNCGLLAFILAWPLGVFGLGMSAKEVLAGWPTTIFFLTVSTGILFGVATSNGTTEALSKRMVKLTKGNAKLIPAVFFIFSALISACGGGAPICGVILPVALTVGVASGVPVTLMSLTTMGGIMVGGLGPLCINGIVAGSLAAANGFPEYYKIWAAYAIGMTAFSIAAYFILGGLKIKKIEHTENIAVEKFTVKQYITMAAIVAVVVAVIAFKQDLSLVAFFAAGLLLLFGVGEDEKKIVVNCVPWNVVMMIGGMSILLNVVVKAGGIDYISNALASIVNPRIAPAIMSIMGSLLGAVSSGTGVAMPTLVPVAASMAADLGIAPGIMIVADILGTNGVVISPLSTVGAMSVASAPEGTDRTKLFNQLLIAAGCWMVWSALMALLGVYKLIALA